MLKNLNDEKIVGLQWMKHLITNFNQKCYEKKVRLNPTHVKQKLVMPLSLYRLSIIETKISRFFFPTNLWWMSISNMIVSKKPLVISCKCSSPKYSGKQEK